MPWAVVAAVVDGCTRFPQWTWSGTGRGLVLEVEAAVGITNVSTSRGVAPVAATVVAAEELVVGVVEDEGVAMSCSSRAGRIKGVSQLCKHKGSRCGISLHTLPCQKLWHDFLDLSHIEEHCLFIK